jgi:hypothetical protein
VEASGHCLVSGAPYHLHRGTKIHLSHEREGHSRSRRMKPKIKKKIVNFVHIRQTALSFSSYIPSLSQNFLSFSSCAFPFLFIPFLTLVSDIFVVIFVDLLFSRRIHLSNFHFHAVPSFFHGERETRRINSSDSRRGLFLSLFCFQK